jgi:multiple sugar transport system substrate-binding protein
VTATFDNRSFNDRKEARMNTRSALALLMAACAVSGVVAGCSSSSSSSSSSGKQITVWSEENDADRITATKANIAKFTAQTGIKVKLVGIDGDQFQSLITSDAAAGTLPDVVGAVPLNDIQYLATNDLVNTDATQAVVSALGSSTFTQQALTLTKYKGKQVSIPSDAWVQLLVYRKDLFAKAGLAPPTTFDAIQKAAQRLNSSGTAGITMATDASDAFTEQTFEYFALANGCQLVDGSGKVTLDSPACQHTFDWYANLVRKDSVRGTQTVDTTRATYFAGKAAMFVWSSYVLDEMAGLRKDALPTCSECRSDPTFLVKNSGIVTAVQGPDGTAPAQFGEIGSWAITKSSHASAAQQFVEYMMGTGYPAWLGLSPEGKFPVRTGTAGTPNAYVTAWQNLKTGVDTKAPLSQFYPASLLDTLANSPKTISRWGLSQGQGALAGAVSGRLVIPKAVAAAANGSASATDAAKQAQDAATQIKSTLK